jgi:phosphate transport system substrate-binding protein
MSKWRGIWQLGLVITVAILMTACSKAPTVKEAEDAGLGGDTIKVSIDETLKNVMEQEVEVFNYLQDTAILEVVYLPEAEVMNDLREKRADIVLIAREFSVAEEKALIESKKQYTKNYPIASDAIAIIADKDYGKKGLDVEELKKLLTTNSTDKTAQLVFDNKESGVIKNIQKFVGGDAKLSSSLYALKSSEEVIEYVQQNKNALGFISYSVIGDTDDLKVKAVLEKVKVLSLKQKNAKGEIVETSATQNDIAYGAYPLTRPVTAITKYKLGDTREWDFISFLTRSKGARIFLKAGLIPYIMPEREVIINTSPIKVE